MKLYQVFNEDGGSDFWFANKVEAKKFKVKIKKEGGTPVLKEHEYAGKVTRASVAWMLTNWPKRI